MLPSTRRIKHMKSWLTVCLVINIMEDISPEDIQQLRADHESVHRHPQSISEGRESKTDDEVGEDGRYEDDERFSGDKIKEEPHDPHEEGLGCWLEISEPVGDYGEDNVDQD
jgi:hypothetical protein